MDELVANIRMAKALFSSSVKHGGRTHEGRCTAHLRVRGENTRDEIATTCKGLEQAVRFARRIFKDFDDRNPWVFHDSVLGALYILVDAESSESFNPQVTELKR